MGLQVWPSLRYHGRARRSKYRGGHFTLSTAHRTLDVYVSEGGKSLRVHDPRTGKLL